MAGTLGGLTSLQSCKQVHNSPVDAVFLYARCSDSPLRQILPYAMATSIISIPHGLCLLSKHVLPGMYVPD